MKLVSITLHQVSIPLVTPFETSFMRETEKDCYLVEATFDTDRGRITGWGESVAMISPLYSSEYVAAGIDVTRRWLAPILFGVEDLTAETVGWHLRHVVGHPMAKSALEMAVIDAQLQVSGQSFKSYLAGSSTPCPRGCRWASRTPSRRRSGSSATTSTRLRADQAEDQAGQGHRAGGRRT